MSKHCVHRTHHFEVVDLLEAPDEEVDVDHRGSVSG